MFKPNSFLRPGTCLFPLALAVAAFAVAFAASPMLPRSLGVDVWNLPKLHQEVSEAKIRNSELDRQEDMVRRRIVIKESLITEMIAARISLQEAVEQFLLLNQEIPEYMAVIRTTYPGSNDFEKTTQNVIDFATVRVAPGKERKELVARLESERVKMLRPDTVH